MGPGLAGWLGYHYWRQLFAPETKDARGRFIVWAGKGLMAPLLFWAGLNAGIFSGLNPLLPEAALVRSSPGSGFLAWFDVMNPSFVVISSFWAAATFIWMIAVISRKLEGRTEMVSVSVVWGVLMSPVAWGILHFLGPGALGFALLVWLAPAVHFTLPLTQKPASVPTYSRAVAKMKFGKYADAEWDLLHELENCDEDFDGWMMLAELYARHFKELSEADRIIRDLCDQPNVIAVQISIALSRLADWHLELSDDPVSARGALEEIGRRLPDSHFARMARQRIGHLPADRQELREQRRPKIFRVPALNDTLDEPAPPVKTALGIAQAKAQAEEFVAKLRQNPNDVAAREKLAVLMAESLDRADLAIDQLELLIAMPDQPSHRTAEWLGMAAAWLIKYRNDGPKARIVLERLIDQHPQSAQAFAAQRRLNLLDMESRLRQSRSGSA